MSWERQFYRKNVILIHYMTNYRELSVLLAKHWRQALSRKRHLHIALVYPTEHFIY